MSFKMSDVEQTIKIYNLRSDTKEFIGEGDAYIAPHTGLPADCTDVKPPKITEGKVAVFDGGKGNWSLVDDFRGIVVVTIETQEKIYINDLGPIPENTTTLIPDGPYKKWDGNAWVDDTEALKNGLINDAELHRQTLLAEAKEVTADWRTDLQLDNITDEDKALLTEWMNYIKELKGLDFSEIETQEDYESIPWPEKP